MPDLIRHPEFSPPENELDSAKASLGAQVKPGMTKTAMMAVSQASARLSLQQ
ncbi:MAG: hypothetical protein PVF56_14755 [Desulfobacterales bacterium]|jgi:hypothetical protein